MGLRQPVAIIPNGVDYQGLSRLPVAAADAPPTVALVGRVVPIKDIITYLHAIKIVHAQFPDLVALVLGPTEEQPEYYETCKAETAALGLTAITVPAAADAKAHVQAVADAVTARPKGEAVLVVGHSNTIPAIVHALGGPALPDLCESEYDQLFILSFDGGASPKLVRARFGAPDDPDAPPCTRTMRQ